MLLWQVCPHSRVSSLPSPMVPWIIGLSMPKTTLPFTLPKRIQALTVELRDRAPEWADRLSSTQSYRELLEAVGALFNLAHALKDPLRSETLLSARIDAYMEDNLHMGLTLKLLAQHLGYSEKYCSDLFHTVMGETFSEALKCRRIRLAGRLLTTTDQAIADIARAVGFSDQFAFSHFFKRETGRSPLRFRSEHRRIPGKTSTPVSPEPL